MRTITICLQQTILLAGFAGLFYVLEYGFNFDSQDKLFYSIFLAGFAVLVFLNRVLRRVFFYLSLGCLVIMAVAHVFNFVQFARAVGDFGFSLLLITTVSYLPQLVRKGYIKGF